MSENDLREEVAYQLRQIAVVVEELSALDRDLTGRQPTNREIAAASSFLVQFYTGVENILKRISKYHGVAVPNGSGWHGEILERFRQPLQPGLPALLHEGLFAELSAFRRFRHVARVTYGIELN